MFKITYKYWRLDSPTRTAEFSNKESANYWFNFYNNNPNCMKVKKHY